MAEREEAWSGDNLIGLVAYYINHDTQKAFITNVSVDIRFQKQGIATTLLENVKCAAVNERMNFISLEVAQDERLMDFYRHNGFVEEKQIPNGNKILIKNLVPIVVIRCTVYNHEPYLRDCLEGFVMQQTNFPFVAIVHDDASTDNSAAIIREYEEKYPNIIKPIYETENQYSKQDGSLGRIMNAAIEATGAKYVAMCEGDDYWIDPLKLQKQVDFIEANPEYSICFHKVNTLIQATGEIKEEFIVRDMPGKSTILDLAEGNYIHTPSVMYRKYPNILETYQRLMPCLPGDYVMWMLLAEKGNIYKFNEPMAVYRYGSGVWSNNYGINNYLHMIKTLCKLSIVLESSEVRKILQKQINSMSNELSSEYEKVTMQLKQIRSSKAYRLGKFILVPFKKLKQLFKL